MIEATLHILASVQSGFINTASSRSLEITEDLKMKTESRYITTWGNGATIWQPVGVPEFEYLDLLVLGNSTYYIFTVAGYYKEKRQGNLDRLQYRVDNNLPIEHRHVQYLLGDINKDIANSIQNKHPQVAIGARGASICSGQHPDHGKKFFEVEIGMKIRLDGKAYLIKKAPNNNLALDNIPDVQMPEYLDGDHPDYVWSMS